MANTKRIDKIIVDFGAKVATIYTSVGSYDVNNNWQVLGATSNISIVEPAFTETLAALAAAGALNLDLVLSTISSNT